MMEMMRGDNTIQVSFQQQAMTPGTMGYATVQCSGGIKSTTCIMRTKADAHLPDVAEDPPGPEDPGDQHHLQQGQQQQGPGAVPAEQLEYKHA